MSASAARSAQVRLSQSKMRPDRVVETVKLPNGAVRRDHYDLLQRIVLQEQPDGSWLRYGYTAAGTLESVTHSSGQRVEYRYDPGTRQWSARTERTTTTVTASQDGYPQGITLEVDGHSWSVVYQRDGKGRVVACGYPQGKDWLRSEKLTQSEFRLSSGDQQYFRMSTNEQEGSATVGYANGTHITEWLTHDKKPRFRRSSIQNGSDAPFEDLTYRHDDKGRLRQVGSVKFAYEENGRLKNCASAKQMRTFFYDKRGRMRRWRSGTNNRTFRYGEAPMVSAVQAEDGSIIRFDYDALGRRVARHDGEGTTRYAYDLFGQLEHVSLPDGRSIRYIYDGFGRLVGREADGRTTYYIIGVDGERLAQADAAGQITDSYLWLGLQCVGRIKGVMGEALAQTFHRLPGSMLAHIVEDSGHIRQVAATDPFGGDTAVEDAMPGYAGLFGDPLTTLLLAGSRWLDPSLAQFLTPDSWFGETLRFGFSPRLRSVLDALPGGTARLFSPESAYNWCAHDPINFSDPNGHNWLGLIFSSISALLWELQLTSIALQMEVLNIILDILVFIPWLIIDKDQYWFWSAWNLAPPVFSYRLMVPLAFIFSGLLRFQPDRAWTLGNVIWARGDSLRELEAASKRDLVICSNAADYLGATDRSAADIFRARNPNAIGGGTVANGATSSQITGATVTVPAGAAVTDIFRNNNFIAIRRTGTTTDEIRRIVTSGATIDLTAPTLPGEFDTETVEISRLDQTIARITRDQSSIARGIAFISGTVLHIGKQIPAGFPTESLNVVEFVPAGRANRTPNVNFPVEQIIIRMAQDSDLTDFTAGDFIRIISGVTPFARQIQDIRSPVDLVLDTALPAGTHTGLEVTRMIAAGAVAPNMAALTGPGGEPRVSADRLTDLQELDGVQIQGTGAPAPENRIATRIFLDCAVAALPATLHGVAIEVDILNLDSISTAAQMSGATGRVIETDAGGAAKFKPDQAVRVRDTANNVDAHGVIESVDPDADQITLFEALTFAANTPVEVNLMTGKPTFPTENVAAPGDRVLVQVAQGTDLNLGDIIRVRLASEKDGGAARQINTDPTVIAQLDTALTGATTTNLSVQRFAPDIKRTGASAPEVRPRLVIPGATNPFAVGNNLFIVDATNEQIISEAATIDGQNVILRDPVELPLGTPVTVTVVVSSGIQTTDAKLDEGLMLIPSDPGETPLTRREALEHHEMRHVWQGAIWGPMLISLPIPWLVNVAGFALSDSEVFTRNKILRHLSVGGLNSLATLLVWGVGRGVQGLTTLAFSKRIGIPESDLELAGTIADVGARQIQFAVDADSKKVGRFSPRSAFDLIKEGQESFNVVETLDRDAKRITVRFPLKGFQAGDAVTLSVSPFEQIRKVIDKYFSFDLKRVWEDHIPVGWARVLTRILDREAWLPFLGIYFLSLYAVGGNSNSPRLPNEQDAAFHSGDLYTDFPLGPSKEIFVGQFARIFGFFQNRENNDAVGIAERNLLTLLRVRPDTATGVTIDAVTGGIPIPGTGEVRFRENYYIPMHERVENVVGALFSASAAGTYDLVVDGMLDEDVVLGIFFDTDFTDLRRVKVKNIVITPDVTGQFFETEDIDFAIEGDASAEYRLRFPPNTAGNVGIPSGKRYTAPVATAASITQNLEITATYREDHPVFHGEGQQGEVFLTSEQRTNLCTRFTLTIEQLTPPTVGPVTAGTTTDFTMPIAPKEINVPPALPAGATINARVISKGGRLPANLTFVAPDRVTAATNITFEMIFRSEADPAIQRPIPVTVTVNPA